MLLLAQSLHFIISRFLWRFISYSIKFTNHKPLKKNEIEKLISESDEPKLLLDLRTLNGNLQESKFDQFSYEGTTLFKEKQTAISDIRHSSASYLSFSISKQELVDREACKIPDINIPSPEWVWSQFPLLKPCSKSALKHVGWFDINYKAQCCQTQLDHPDSK